MNYTRLLTAGFVLMLATGNVSAVTGMYGTTTLSDELVTIDTEPPPTRDLRQG
jgi:hypothetical protein